MTTLQLNQHWSACLLCGLAVLLSVWGAGALEPGFSRDSSLVRDDAHASQNREMSVLS